MAARYSFRLEFFRYFVCIGQSGTASLVFFAIANPVKAVKSRDGWFRIKGCSREFLATLPVQQSPF